MNFNKLFSLALEKGITDFQVIYSGEGNTSITVYDSKLQSFETSYSETLAAKGIYNGKMGTYITEVFSTKDFPSIVDHVIESAKTITSKDEVFIYEGDAKYKKLPFLYNKFLGEIKVEDKIKMALNLASMMSKRDNVTYAEADYNESNDFRYIINSKGLKLKVQNNGASLSASCVVLKDGDTRTGYETYVSNDFSKFDLEYLANTAYSNALSSVGAKPVKSKNYMILLNESVTSTILESFESIFSSEAVYKNLSVLKGKIGEVIGSKKVTLVDDPFLKTSLSSMPFDNEGVGTQYKEIVKNGVLQEYIYNLKMAKIFNKKSTGNGFGSGISFINFHFKPGRKTKEEIISKIKNGLYITDVQGSSSSIDSISGSFSLQSSGYVIKDGKVSDPVALITISSDIINLLKNVSEVSNTLKNGDDSPAILIKKMSVGGM